MRRRQPDRRTFLPAGGFLGNPAPASREFLESRRLLQQRAKAAAEESQAARPGEDSEGEDDGLPTAA